MSKTTLVGLVTTIALGAAFTATLPISASADIVFTNPVSQTANFPSLNGSANLTFNGFNASLGTLQNVVLTMNVNGTLNDVVVATQAPGSIAVGAPIPLTATANTTVTGPAGLSIQSLITTAGFAGNVTFQTTFVPVTVGTKSLANSGNSTASNNLTPFLGASNTYTITISETGSQGGSVPPGVSTGNSGNATIVVSIQYGYFAAIADVTPTPTPTPTPAPVLLPDGQQVPGMLTALVAGIDALDDAILVDFCDTRRPLTAEPGRACERRPLGNGVSAELWFETFGGFGGLSGNGTTMSFSNTFAGTIAGIGLLNEHWAGGVGVGFLAPWLNMSNGSHASMNSGFGFIYGRYLNGPVWLGAMASYGGGRVNSSRNAYGTGLTATGNYGSDFGSLDLRGSYTWQKGAYMIQPRAGISFIHATQGSFGDIGAGLLNLQYGRNGVDTGRVWFSLRVLRDVQVRSWWVQPWVEAGVTDTFSGVNRTVLISWGSLSTTVNGVSPASLAGTAGAGVQAALTDRLHAFVRYEGVFSANQTENIFSLGAKYHF